MRRREGAGGKGRELEMAEELEMRRKAGKERRERRCRERERTGSKAVHEMFTVNSVVLHEVLLST